MVVPRALNRFGQRLTIITATGFVYRPKGWLCLHPLPHWHWLPPLIAVLIPPLILSLGWSFPPFFFYFFSTINCRVNSFVRSIWGSGTLANIYKKYISIYIYNIHIYMKIRDTGYRCVNRWSHSPTPIRGATNSHSDSQCQRPSVDRLNEPKGHRGERGE